MSAIFGIINKDGTVVTAADVQAMQQALQHRATDGSGIWQQRHALLGICSLHISSPIANTLLPQHHLVITANALLSNRNKLIKLLDLDNLADKLTEADIILHSYLKWGKQCLQHLEGEFAFCIYHTLSSDVFIATDHLGHQPVFYADLYDKFIFCSELKGITAIKSVPHQFDEQSLLEYWLKGTDVTHTYNQHIKALPGGCSITLTSGGTLTIERYWTPTATGKYNFSKEQQWADCLQELLYRAIAYRLPADLPVGITLSGGLDSTGITFILSDILKKRNQPLYAFSSVLPLQHQGVERDEREYIELTGRHCSNLIQTYVSPSAADLFACIPQGLTQDESFPNVFCYVDCAILEAARQQNIRTLYSGYGGDFWVSWEGSSVVRALVNQGRLQEASSVLNAYAATGNKNVARVFKTEYLARTKAYQYLWYLLKAKGINWSKETFLKAPFLKQHKLMPPVPVTDINSWMANYITSGRISKTLGTFANRNESYAMSAATPMFDKAIAEFLMDVPLPVFVMGGHKRGLFRAAMKGIVPDELRLRKDKLPYAPGYHQRLIQNKPFFDQLLNAPEYRFVFDQYLDKAKIAAYFNEVKPQKGFTPSRDIVGIKLIQAAITAITLNELNKQRYFN